MSDNLTNILTWILIIAIFYVMYEKINRMEQNTKPEHFEQKEDLYEKLHKYLENNDDIDQDITGLKEKLKLQLESQIQDSRYKTKEIVVPYLEDDLGVPEMEKSSHMYLKDIEYKTSISESNNCLENHVHDKCKHGHCNHMNPNRMSRIDKDIHMTPYPQNMSMQDYIDWLWCYDNENKRMKLCYKDMCNLDKIKERSELSSDDIKHVNKNHLNDIRIPYHILLAAENGAPGAFDNHIMYSPMQ